MGLIGVTTGAIAFVLHTAVANIDEQKFNLIFKCKRREEKRGEEKGREGKRREEEEEEEESTNFILK